MTKTFLAQNKFDSTAIQPPAVETLGAARTDVLQTVGTTVSARSEINSDGVGAKPILAFTPSEAATVSGRAPVAATLSHNKITQAVEIQSSCDSTEVRRAKTGNKPGLVPGEEISSSATSFERVTVRGAAIQPCAGVTPSSQEANPALPVSSEPSLPADAPTVSAGFLENELAQLIGANELAQLIGAAGKRRRLALPRFVPDEDAIEAAARDPNAPRAALDSVWDDPPPLFLKG